jgi:hypothetical protein
MADACTSCMQNPVRLDATQPASYDRAQLVLRLVIMVLMGMVGCTLGWLFGVLYLGLPAVAAIAISRRDGAAYLADVGPRVVRALRWVLALYAYLGLVTDQPPTSEAELGVELEVTLGGAPTPTSALFRLITSIPAALILVLLGAVSAAVWVIAAIWALAVRTVPAVLFDYQRGVLRWQARLFAYHASLVDRSPLAYEAGATPTQRTT